MMRRILLPLCAFLVVAAPAFASGAEHGPREMRGTVSSVGDDGIVVRRGDLKLSCVRIQSSPATDRISIGDRVLILCRRSHDGLVLLRVKKLPDEARNFEQTGKVSVLAGDLVTVRNDANDRKLTCSAPARLAELMAALAVGDRVAVLCRGPRNRENLELVKLVKLHPSDQEGGSDKPALGDIAGRVSAIGDGKITIQNGDSGHTLTCRFTPALADTVAGIELGDAARMRCSGDELVAIQRAGGSPPPPPVTPTSFTFTGVLKLLSPDRVGVVADGEGRSCFVPVALRPQLIAYSLGQSAALSCQGADAAHASLTAIAHVGGA
jgi:hypothetical protein